MTCRKRQARARTESKRDVNELTAKQRREIEEFIVLVETFCDSPPRPRRKSQTKKKKR